MNQTNKINKALKIIYNYLPSTYPKVGIKIYKTCYAMIRASARDYSETYRWHCKWYNKYYKKTDKTDNYYINTKYYKCKKVNHLTRVLGTTALSGNPIFINLENTKYHTLKNYTFLLLHEVGHSYYTPKGQKYNEHLCDLFAIRWYKRIFKL